MATTQVHLPASRRLLRQAEREYQAGRMMQASAKGWQAVAHAIEHIARQRNWPHETEADLFQATTKVAHELDNLEVLDLTLEASALEYNSHEGWYPKGGVKSALKRMAEFVELLEDVAANQ